MSEIFNAGASIYKLVKVTKMHFKVFRWFISPILSIILSAYLTGALRAIVPLSTLPAIVFSVVIYFALLRLTRAINEEEIRWAKGIFKQKRCL